MQASNPFITYVAMEKYFLPLLTSYDLLMTNNDLDNKCN